MQQRKINSKNCKAKHNNIANRYWFLKIQDATGCDCRLIGVG
jgi:hypothetical protein